MCQIDRLQVGSVLAAIVAIVCAAPIKGESESSSALPSKKAARVTVGDLDPMTSFQTVWDSEAPIDAVSLQVDQPPPVPETEEYFEEEMYFGGAPLFWARGEFLLWWTKGNDLPPLVTTGTAGDGVLGAADTTILFGGHEVDHEDRSGLRINMGRWLDDNATAALVLDYFSVFDDTGTGDFDAQSTGTPLLARPFFNTTTNAEDSEFIAQPGRLTGEVAIGGSSEMHSIAALFRHNVRRGSMGRVDLLLGYRFFRFRDGLSIEENLVSIDPGGLVPVGTTIDLADRFVAENNFHGADLGVAVELYRDLWTIEGVAKVALGDIQHVVSIDGSTTVTTPGGAPVTSSGGLLALPTNMGRFSNHDFGALPEFGLNGSLALTQSVDFTIGYTLAMLNNVARSGGQIDRTINPTQIGGGALAGAARPQVLLGDDDFWVQGLNFGFTWRR